MTELGLMSGDPCAADEWDRDQRIRALAWWFARWDGVEWSSFGASARDIHRVFMALVDACRGLREFVFSGIVNAVSVRRG